MERNTVSKILLASLGAVCAASLSACDGNGEEAHEAAGHTAITTEALEPYECGSVQRLHTMGGVFLASQPQPDDFAQAKKGGVKSVINIRHEDEDPTFDERRAIADLGLNYYNPAFNGPEEFTDAVIDENLRLLRTVERPVLYHCASANRVGAVWYIYRRIDGGLSHEAALAEAKTVGLKSPDYERMAADYVNRRG